MSQNNSTLLATITAVTLLTAVISYGFVCYVLLQDNENTIKIVSPIYNLYSTSYKFSEAYTKIIDEILVNNSERTLIKSFLFENIKIRRYNQ
jgi:hypothetical protein